MSRQKFATYVVERGVPRTGRPKAMLDLTTAEQVQLTRWTRRRKSSQRWCCVLGSCWVVRRGCRTSRSRSGRRSRRPRWASGRSRFVQLRLEGLDDGLRPWRLASITAEQVEDVAIASLEATPTNATHWSQALMSERTGLKVHDRSDLERVRVQAHGPRRSSSPTTRSSWRRSSTWSGST